MATLTRYLLIPQVYVCDLIAAFVSFVLSQNTLFP